MLTPITAVNLEALREWMRWSEDVVKEIDAALKEPRHD